MTRSDGLTWVEDHIWKANRTGLYYWTDETGDASTVGYLTVEEARAALDRYAEWLNEGV